MRSFTQAASVAGGDCETVWYRYFTQNRCMGTSEITHSTVYGYVCMNDCDFSFGNIHVL